MDFWLVEEHGTSPSTGLNEVSADTRTRIVRFVEPKFHGNILLETQRMEWTSPATANLYESQPLTEAQVREFQLQEHLVARAAETHDHTVSDQPSRRFPGRGAAGARRSGLAVAA
ncbi:hypothetical protein CYFUS_007084 [Cystobacter fuscus]|uniref:Uncharacterized protein n=1 Tax=Cystobacter fuscus TaxID=43 RepID=A0A250JDM4_9BACT|nr:hypothetical protein [Cystobacter fuscus]ATB41617.1 hypothetical protein CYFUS_007084 [Cystobacter fuscus]